MQILSFDGSVLDQNCARKALMLWKARCLRAARSHYREAGRLKSLYLWLIYINSLSSIAVAVVAASSYFGVSNDGHVSAYLFLASTVFLLTSIFQNLNRAEERSNEHKLAANEFSNIQRKIERYLCADDVKMGLLHNINRDINFASKSHPMVSGRTWRKPSESDLDMKIKGLEDEIDGVFWAHLAAATEGGEHDPAAASVPAPVAASVPVPVVDGHAPEPNVKS